MKNLHLMLRIIAPVVLLAVLVAAAYPQTRERFGISAKAGGVNAVAGSVMVTRVGQTTPQLLTDREDLVAGDVVTTGAAGQVEVLLNPGSYLRLAPNSEFVMVDNSLNNLVVKLVKGSVVIEATGGDYSDARINVLANQQNLMIIRGGIYRFNVQGNATELLVRKGRVVPANPLGQVFKGGTRVSFATSSFVVAKLNKKDQDDFDFWSKKRAETLARANQKISGRTVNGYLSSMTIMDWALAGNPWGLWTYSPFARCYTFMPFRYGWASPYGHYYDNYYFYNSRGYVNNGVLVGNSSSGGSNSWPGGSGNSSGGGSGSSGSSSTVSPTAPSAPMGSQAGRTDPDSGNRIVNKIRDPND